MKTEEKTNEAINGLGEWVTGTFQKDEFLTKQSFNVHAYTEEQKIAAIKHLNEAGYSAELENNGNSLKVTKG